MRSLVFVTRPNAALRRPDLATRGCLTKRIDVLVYGEHDMCALADQQSPRRRNPALVERRDLVQQACRVDDRALADDALGRFVKNT
jgi:hypothetical protein